MQSDRQLKAKAYAKGKKFSRLTLTGKTNFRSMYGQHRRVVEAECECGVTRWYLLNSLMIGDTKSCGCLKSEVTRERMTTHGLSDHPLYDVYHKMLSRCFLTQDPVYHRYGGRGIGVCEEWQENFVTFYEWSMVNGWEPGLTLDRKNNDGHYEPNNCRFTGSYLQSRNTSRNRNFTAFGETKCLFDWGQDPRSVLNEWGLRSRVDSGNWPDFEKALTEPFKDRKQVSRNMGSNKMLTAFGETKCQSAWLEDDRCVVKKDGLMDRLKRGWEVEKALTTLPIDSKRRLYLTAFGERKGIIEWSKDVRCVIGLDGLRDRIKLGMNHEEAITTPKRNDLKYFKYPDKKKLESVIVAAR